jgi:hypothetical protein
MNSVKRLRCVRLMAAAPLVGLLAGCGSGLARYTPTADEARSSLEAVLTSWRNGKPFGEVESKLPVRAVDSAWQGGQQLESFEIGDQEDGADGTKEFTVKLTIKNKKATEDVRYVVHGRDPVWVFRAEDYKRTLNMENNPVTTPKSNTVPIRSRRTR